MEKLSQLELLSEGFWGKFAKVAGAVGKVAAKNITPELYDYASNVKQGYKQFKQDIKTEEERIMSTLEDRGFDPSTIKIRAIKNPKKFGQEQIYHVTASMIDYDDDGNQSQGKTEKMILDGDGQEVRFRSNGTREYTSGTIQDNFQKMGYTITNGPIQAGGNFKVEFDDMDGKSYIAITDKFGNINRKVSNNQGQSQGQPQNKKGQGQVPNQRKTQPKPKPSSKPKTTPKPKAKVAAKRKPKAPNQSRGQQPVPQQTPPQTP